VHATTTNKNTARQVGLAVFGKHERTEFGVWMAAWFIFDLGALALHCGSLFFLLESQNQYAFLPLPFLAGLPLGFISELFIIFPLFILCILSQAI